MKGKISFIFSVMVNWDPPISHSRGQSPVFFVVVALPFPRLYTCLVEFKTVTKHLYTGPGPGGAGVLTSTEYSSAMIQ